MDEKGVAKADRAAAGASEVDTRKAAAAEQPVSLTSWGSFHVGGRLVEIDGKSMREVVFSPRASSSVMLHQGQ